MKELISEIIRESIDELNAQLDEEEKLKSGKLESGEEVRLIGPGAVLDSLSFVTLIAIIEDRICERIGKSLIIVNEKAFSEERSPFQTVASLRDYIAGQLVEEGRTIERGNLK